jgi:heat shock protein HslJ|uniref:DUF4377 domain-containing protein n=1 Tax=Gelidibacter sp. TaxID=2018083 RepID=UPI004048F08F
MKSRILSAICLLALVFSCSKDNEKILFVSDVKMDCTGVAPQKCLQIKEKESDDWMYFYSDIEGFDYEEGYNYKIKVEVSEVENVPADASSLKYTLLEVIEKTKAPRSLAKGSWMVIKVMNVDTFDRNPFFSVTPSDNSIKGSTGCNRFFGTIKMEGEIIQITNVGATKMMCANMDAENAFMEAINSTTSYKIENDVLKFLSESNEVVMECSFLKD